MIKKLKYWYFLYKNVKVGKGTRLITSFKNFASEPYLVTIGENCIITSGVKFLTHDASISVALRYLGKDRIVKDSKYEILGKIVVGDNCMIGINSIIMPGVTIGNNSIIGSGSVVTKDIPENTVFAGNPAKFICTIEEYSNKAMGKMTLIQMSKDYQQRKINILKHFVK